MENRETGVFTKRLSLYSTYVGWASQLGLLAGFVVTTMPAVIAPVGTIFAEKGVFQSELRPRLDVYNEISNTACPTRFRVPDCACLYTPSKVYTECFIEEGGFKSSVHCYFP